MSTLHLTSENFDEVAGSGRVLVDFWADWCGPCKMLGPVIDNLAVEFEGRAKVAKVNVDSEKELARRFKVMSIPTVVIFNDGAEVKRIVGVKEKGEYAAGLSGK